MDDLNEDTVDTDHQADSQPDHTAATDPTNQPIELPDDPAQLRDTAITLTQQLADNRRIARESKRETVRLQEKLDEERAKSSYATGKLEILEKQGVGGKAENGGSPKQKPNKVAEALKGVDLGELALEDNGAEKLAEVLEKAGFVTVDRMEEFANRRFEMEGQKSAGYKAVAKLYPELENPESALTKATWPEFNKIKSQNPNLSDPEALELAASRAEKTLPKSKPSNGGGDSDRLRNAQGGGGTSRLPFASTGQVDESLMRMAARTAPGLSQTALREVALEMKEAAKHQQRR